MNLPGAACNTAATSRFSPVGEMLGWQRSLTARRPQAASCWISVDCWPALRARASSNSRTDLAIA
eukprot:4069069-Lingulodinium_polyedra.AAC.1